MSKVRNAGLLVMGAVVLTPMMGYAGQASPASAAAAKPAMTSAGQAGPAAKAAKATPGLLGDLWGDVDHIGSDMKSIFIRDKKGHLHKVVIGSGDTLTKGADNHKISLGDIKKGDRIRIRKRGHGVQDIHVLVLAAPPSKRFVKKEMRHPRRFAIAARLRAQELKLLADLQDKTIKPEEAKKLTAELAKVRRQERELAKADKGHLNAKSYGKLQSELNKTGAARHDSSMGTQAPSH